MRTLQCVRKSHNMKQLPLVSIALCTYNGAEYLTAQLNTLLNQTYGNIEIIVVDDGSTDGTSTILKHYAAKYPQFKVYQNESNLGYTKNFERAVTLCSGELIALCDQDDLWHPQKIELQVNAIKDNVLIYHDSAFIADNGTSMNKKISGLMNLYKGSNPNVFLFFNCVSGHSILMKKALLHHALPFKHGYFHDRWLAYVATNIGKIDFIPQCLVQYRQHSKNETNILQLARKKHKYKASPFENFELTLNWLHHCQCFKGNKNQAFINRIYTAYKKRQGSYLPLQLLVLLLKYWKILFFIRKKTFVSKLNYIRKHFLGVKSKSNPALL